MAKLSPAIILVKNIRCDVAKQQFSAEKLERAARLIIDIEGIISPIIVRREGVEHYRLIHGEFEYHAAMRAREIDSIRGESIDAYIVNAENQETIEQQIQVFREHKQPSEQIMNYISGQQLESLFKSCLQPVMDRLMAIEAQLAHTTIEIPQSKPQQEIQPKSTHTDSKIELLAQEIEEVILLPETPASIPAYLQLINELQSDRLTERLKQLSINKTITEEILAKRPFASEQALKGAKGIGAKTIQKLQTLSTLPEPIAVKPKLSKQAVSPIMQKEVSTTTDSFLNKLNQMDKVELFFKVKRATNLNDNKINKLIGDRPYQALSDIKTINKNQLEKIRLLLTE
jgi:hypothetical protein